MIKLGELEFKPEDFAYNDTMLDFSSGKKEAELANRLLRERLEKAPQVFNVSEKKSKTYYWREAARRFSDDKIAARLVCLEEI